MKKKCKKKVSMIEKKSEPHAKDEVNPFELKINRRRYTVLGQKWKHDRGKPGVSRNRAVKKRLELFKKSLILSKKSNAFIDKRIGEHDETALKEDVIAERMMQARKKKYKKNIYNLNDEESLTHYGQPVMDMEEFDIPDDDSEEEDDAQLGADFVDKVHFGGFLTKKTETDAPKTRKEIIGDLILESKRKKEEKRAEKEQNDDLTEKLDREWKDVHILASALRKSDTSVGAKRDPYDTAVQELKFEPRVAPTKSVITEEEIKEAEQKKLWKLEKDRIARMREDDNAQNQDFLSADSIYDGLEIDNKLEQIGSTDGEESDSDSESSFELHCLQSLNSNTDNSIENGLENMEGKRVEAVNNDLAGNYDIPQTARQLANLLSSKSVQEIASSVEKIIENSKPGEGADKQRYLETFFSVLLEFVAPDYIEVQLDYVDALVPHLYTLCQFPSLKTGERFRSFIMKKITNYRVNSNLHRYISLDMLIVLKLSGILYSTSDFRHPVATPVLLFMSDVLTNPFKVTLPNILSRMFVTCLFYEYLAFSKRLATEPIYFLNDILYLACVNPNLEYSVRHKNIGRSKGFLHVETAMETTPKKLSLRFMNRHEISECKTDIEISIIFCAVIQLNNFVKIYAEMSIFQELFSTTKKLCECLPLNFYPRELKSAVEKLKLFISKWEMSRTHLTYPKKRPRMLKLFEPNFEVNVTDKNMSIKKKQKIEKQLSQKIKKEEKGVIREIRRDAQFLSRQHLQEQVEADEERNRKVKRLYQELSMQECEFKKFVKKK